MSMIDLGKTIQAKSDQLNAGDIAGDKTIKITKATDKGAADQPVSIFFEGDGGKPWKPCKSMRRVMAQLWGEKIDPTGRYITLVCDPTVTWGGEEVGGIRIKAMSDISGKKSVPVRASKHKVKKYTIEPINVDDVPQVDAEAILKGATEAANNGIEEYKSFFAALNNDERKAIAHKHEELKALAEGEQDDGHELSF